MNADFNAHAIAILFCGLRGAEWVPDTVQIHFILVKIKFMQMLIYFSREMEVTISSS